MLPDDQAARIEAGLASADPATLARWLRLLLDDRRARTALLLGQTRRLSYARKRLAQAFAYMDRLLRAAEDEARPAWRDKLPCPHSGAPTAVVNAEQRRQGHAIVHAHPDGVHCEDPERRGQALPPASDPTRPRPGLSSASTGSGGRGGSAASR